MQNSENIALNLLETKELCITIEKLYLESKIGLESCYSPYNLKKDKKIFLIRRIT
jgi:hypothetical protein